MTANEMADELELRLDRSFSYGSPGYEDYELSSVLNQALAHYVKTFYSEKNNRKGHGFEESEVRNQGLAELIKNSASSLSASQVGVLRNGAFYDLPQDFMYTILETVEVNILDCDNNNKLIDVEVTSHDEHNRVKGNKYRRASGNIIEPRVLRIGFSRTTSTYSSTGTVKRHELITDGSFNIVNYTMRYLTNPPEIIVDRSTTVNQRSCILDESTHNVIIDTARDIMLGIVKEQKAQNETDLKDLE
tara:strand:- start:583 stop:1320 length:738 start_codon:yes stop_codon:yes gene_type:complete